MDRSMDRLMDRSMDRSMDRWIDQWINKCIGGWMEGWIVAHFTKGTRIKAWGQWSEEEEEGRGNWEDISAAIEFAAGHNGDGGGGVSV